MHDYEVRGIGWGLNLMLQAVDKALPHAAEAQF